MAVSIDVDTDLKPLRPNLDSDQAEIMVTDALALAAQAAPCILDEGLSDNAAAAAKAIIRAAILRWADGGSGVVTQLVAGPQQVTLAPEPRRNLFWPSEINQLAALCSNGVSGKAFTIDTTPPVISDEGS